MIWDEFSQPAKGQLLLKLAKTTSYGNWSWAKNSEGKVGIALELSKDIIASDVATSKYFEINTKSIPLIGNVLTVFCASTEFYEIFEVLCMDLIKSALNAQTESEAISILSNRINIWSKLFSKGFTIYKMNSCNFYAHFSCILNPNSFQIFRCSAYLNRGNKISRTPSTF